MKIITLLLFSVLIISCKKETCTDGILNQDEVQIDCGGLCEACPIEYPETGAYGNNVLFGSDSVIVTTENSSMRAIVPEGSSLKIVLRSSSGEMWFYGDQNNWTNSDVDGAEQSFTVLNAGIADLELHNANTTNTDVIIVKFFENSDAQTKQLILIRE
ncbi:MAG: hypothetical protein MK078_13710 [Crocinitomicaceae bacterium]|nr:hypothetical protein [Crocinitomicaceae bacterium]